MDRAVPRPPLEYRKMIEDYWLEFAKVAVAHALAVASPGPDFAVVLKQSISNGRRAAVCTSVGIGTAILLHVGYSLLGLGFLIRGSATWFHVVEYAGAAHLAWLGLQAIRARQREIDPFATDASREHATSRRAFAAGFLTNALKPEATLLCISLFVLVVSPTTPKYVQAGYGLWMAE